MISAPHSLDQTFILQNDARQFNDLTSPPRGDARPLGELQSAHRLVGKNGEDASADRRRSAHGHTNPVSQDSGRLLSNVAAPATV
jgi:hypothetical protein